ncbi:MAG: Lrp/AsnC ligand binding domain-containing protein [Anaerolineae bacterium]|nr:Lrp/AsnC ligand binding domain-containing protein [Anaerolineae bacterium]
MPNVQSFEQAIRDRPEILECHELAGEDWYIVKVRVQVQRSYAARWSTCARQAGARRP